MTVTIKALKSGKSIPLSSGRTRDAVAVLPRWGRLRDIVGQPKGAIGLVLICFYALLAIAGPWVAPQDPYAQSFTQTLHGPSLAHWFGTDQLGRDMFSRVLTGAAPSMGVGVGGVLIALVIGVPLGIVAGYRGGWVDSLIMRAADVMLSFPDIIFALAIVALLGADTQNVIIAVGLVSVPVYTRTARAVTLSTLAEPYIEGSRTLGCGPLRIVLRHIVPNIAGILLTLSSLLFASTLLTASGLGFLGLGVQPPAPEWGAMLGESRSYITTQPYLSAFPGLLLAFAALAFNLFGEALRNVYDPTAVKIARRKAFAGWFKKGTMRDVETRDDGAAAPRTDSAVHVPRANAALSVRDLHIAFTTPRGPLTAVRGISLDVAPGGTLAVVGESGSGKSTFLRAAATLLPQGQAKVTAGSIRIGNVEVTALSRKALSSIRQKAMGFVFQDPGSALNPVVTIGAQLIEAIRHGTHIDRGEARVQAITLLREVGITAPETRLAMYPHAFSGGMKQRIVIAMALAQRPGLLLADEPTSALDVTIQRQILTLLRERQRASGLAIVLVTHDLRLVHQYADQVAVMYAGRFVEQGPVDRVFDRPLHPYTRALKASSPAPEPRVTGATSNDGASRHLASIQGEAPALDALPTGCAFQARCGVCRDRPECVTHVPVLRRVDERAVACHFAEEWL
ncbi:dipeptide/oligopeptide/nickel ABC transporter permease/ATP-binding protein [Robbsia sp. KACC 23696]|uniref:dipeptide/oligopeptide/nickel ABC transporter permease/ATP-binding protein n=1 Tax=Robbsia sp. KACC 23696 TaxID=3149231 RepID=UPI00325A8E80